MSTEKRLVLFLVLSVATMAGTQFAMSRLGLLPEPPAPAPAAAAKGEAAQPTLEPGAAIKKDNDALAAQPDEGPRKADPAPELSATKKAADPRGDGPATSNVKVIAPNDLVLGSATDMTDDGWRLQVQLDQMGAGVASVLSSRWEAELKDGQPRGKPLPLIQFDPTAPASLSLNLERPRTPGPNPDFEPLVLDDSPWEVVLGPNGKAVQDLVGKKPGSSRTIKGQEVTFRTRVEGASPLTVTRRFRLWQGEDAFETTVRIESPDGDQKVRYDLRGPHGLPIEGEWYTATFRSAFFAGETGTGVKILTLTGDTVAKYQDEPERYTSLPLAYAGVENQYFTSFILPIPRPKTMEASHLAEGRPVVVHVDPNNRMKADVSVVLQSKPIEVGPNRAVDHAYRVYTGPKTAAALAPYAATDLATTRNGFHLWFLGDFGASFISRHVIGPLLERIYAVTAAVSGAFGGTRGNYGIAIILLTMTVRLILFPLGRKQARAAQKMQELQPLLAELKKKLGDDKEAFAREQFALFRKHGVNPMGGCLLVFIQLPVMVGLWQALNNSVALRHSSFLWIRNLAAPDQLFKFPFEIPLLGQFLGPYFNLLPLAVVALMLVQTKLFSPPPTTPEAEMQQKMMKYMMVFMMFMFYKVPAGLSIYLITSSIWQICERLLLPKFDPLAHAKLSAAEGGTDNGDAVPPSSSSKPAPPSRLRNANAEPPSNAPVSSPSGGNAGGWLGGLRERAQQIMDEADKQRTVRNQPPERRDRDRPRPKPGSGPGPGPGRKR
jgi:YidC/Oxa1 family membrane protein insertase